MADCSRISGSLGYPTITNDGCSRFVITPVVLDCSTRKLVTPTQMVSTFVGHHDNRAGNHGQDMDQTETIQIRMPSSLRRIRALQTAEQRMSVRACAGGHEIAADRLYDRRKPRR